MADNAALAKMAQKLRRLSIESTTEAGSGHPTSCMSAAEIMSVLFFDEMRWDPRDPSGRRADIFVLSKGHSAPVLWAALKESGAIDDDLMTLRRHDSRARGPSHAARALGARDDRLARPGPLRRGRDGLGAQARRRAGPRLRADGRRRGGGGVGLGGLGVRRVQPARRTSARSSTSTGSARAAPPCTSTTPRCTSGGGSRSAGRRRSWTGTTWPRSRTCSRARGSRRKPFGIVARTLKGKGVSFVEDKDGWHGKPLKKGEELAKALAELGDTNITLKVEPRRYEAEPKRAEGPIDVKPAYEKGQEVATREAFGTRAGQAGQERAAGRRPRRRHQELDVLATSSRPWRPSASRRATSPSRTWWARPWACPRRARSPSPPPSPAS